MTSSAAVPARGVRLGVDVGSVRVGVAISDPGGILATPVATLPRDLERGTDLDTLTRLVRESDVVEVVVGLPRTLRGEQGPAARSALDYAGALRGRVDPVPVVLVDERMTSVVANRMLSDRGVRGRDRRKVVDQAAAVEILQTRLDLVRGVAR